MTPKAEFTQNSVTMPVKTNQNNFQIVNLMHVLRRIPKKQELISYFKIKILR